MRINLSWFRTRLLIRRFADEEASVMKLTDEALNRKSLRYLYIDSTFRINHRYHLQVLINQKTNLMET